MELKQRYSSPLAYGGAFPNVGQAVLKPSRKMFETPLLQPPNYICATPSCEEWRLAHPLLQPNSPFVLSPLGVSLRTSEPRSMTTGPDMNVHHHGWKPLRSVYPPPTLKHSDKKHWTTNGRSSAGLFTTWPDLSASMATAKTFNTTEKTTAPKKVLDWHTYTMASLR
eukprot:CAMPEP_0119312326 /NCGR_PEP_ID=MMETSP1333-20130426/25917_1 /TAXON_ID=418940 /ORGANISM="Scyphosphaera apsteinii, Strain RCC1455" /LENGTH=166 /DNA_ID=CAMNT_0007316927 /DNA_START=33 /DNA_END=536 /DNA_ORIENTATION=+